MSTVNKDQLIDKIVEASGLDKKTVEKEFKSFVELATGVTKGKPETIEGLGVFRLKKGRLAFETDPTLALEINYKYAGMMPLEIKKASSSDTVESQESELTEVIENETEDLGFEIGKVKPKEEPKPVEEIKPVVVEAKSSDKTESTDEKSDSKVVVTEPIIEKTIESIINPDSKKESSKKKTEPVVFKPKKSDSGNKTLVSISIIAAILVTIALVWMLNRESSVIKESAKASVENSKTVSKNTNSSEPQAQVVKPKEIVEKPIEVKPAVVKKEETKAPIEAKVEVTYGLDGSFSKEVSSYYGIVIYTLSYESSAKAEVDSWAKKGFRSYISKLKVSEEKTLYRVALGQFSTISNAKEAALSLPEPFNNTAKHYIKRLNP